MAAIALSGRVDRSDIPGRHVLRLTRRSNLPVHERKHYALLVSGQMPSAEELRGFPFVFGSGQMSFPAITLPSTLEYLAEGDIIRFVPSQGNLRVVYRKVSRHNVLFITERCNSRCLMCSQPPRDINDGYLADEILQAIPLMAPETPQLCITGGEPTLYFSSLLRIIRGVKENLPRTSLHMLSNGRLFRHLEYAKAIASLDHPDFVIGIPLYSNQPSGHDYIVQSKGAFDETLFGLLNLARYGQKIEIRFVIHRETVPRMVATAKFIARNLPFASNVALMGLEPIGFAKSNLEALWIDPWDYRQELEEAVQILQQAQLRVSVYNHQLCVLPKSIWTVAMQSISDWKNIYLDCCADCSMKSGCAGFFSSSASTHSTHVSPMTHGRTDILNTRCGPR
jgi:His-Xaa-Ser system radical SAM maturase HxsC